MKITNLHPTNCSYEECYKYLPKINSFVPQDLDSRISNARGAAREVVLQFMRHITEISNSNLIRNANTLMTKSEKKVDTEVEFSWISDSHPQSQTKFKLGF